MPTGHRQIVPDLAALRALASMRGGVFLSSDAAQTGFTPNIIRHRLRTGDWLTMRRGCYAESPSSMTADLDRLQIAAALAVVGPGAVASHRSAAFLLDLDVGTQKSPIVWLTRPPTCRNGRHDKPGVIERAAQLPARDVMKVVALPCTTPTRTIVDLARHLSFADAVAYTDSALRSKAVTTASLDELLTAYQQWPGSIGARRVFNFATGLAESPLESYSRVLVEEAGLPRPELQQVIRIGNQFSYRADFYWPTHRTIGEADGRLKYADPTVLWAEKRREDHLRALGFQVVRWSWNDVFYSPYKLVTRLRSALDPGARARLRTPERHL